MILNEKKLLITLRNKPKICLIKLSIHANEIWLDAPGMDTLKIVYDADVSSNKFFEFDVWGTTAKGEYYILHIYNYIFVNIIFFQKGHEYSEEASEWLSKYIDCKVHLIKFSDGVHDRITNSKTEKVTNPVVYQDGFPAFLTNQTSIDDLNSRLSRQDRVTYRSFRPNIHIVNGEPYEEDNWFNFKINGLQFKHIHPCARCTTTLVNPDNGVKNENFEPLKTLRTYRILDEYKHLFDKAPLFGINLVSLNSGIIKINDELKILDHKH